MDIDTDEKKKDDFIGAGFDITKRIQFKMAAMLFIVFIVVCSDVFTTRVLSRFSSAVDHKQPTSWGVVLQGTFVVLCFVVLDALVGAGVL